MTTIKKSKKAAAKKTTKKVSTKATAKPKSRVRTGTKRSPADLSGIKEKIGNAIAANPGIIAEDIATTIGASTVELALPLRQLRASKAYSTTGTRRFIRYYPKGQAPRVAKQKAKGSKS